MVQNEDLVIFDSVERKLITSYKKKQTKMFSKLDNILCIDRKRDNRKSSFLIRDILEEGEEEEDIVVADEEEFHHHHQSHHGVVPQVPASLISLPQGTLWDPHVALPYPGGHGIPSHEAQGAPLISGARALHARGTPVCSGTLSLCCLNCPPQSWHASFPAELLSPGVVCSSAGSTGVCVGLMPPPVAAAAALLASSSAGTAPTAVSWSAAACLAGSDRIGALEHSIGGGPKEGSNKGSNGPPRKVRRNRTVFTELQLMGLERRFDCQKYLSTPDRAELARALGLTQLQVKTWYQNRRMKWKKQVMQGGCTVPPTKPKGRPKKNSIPSLNETRASNDLLGLKDNF